MRNSKKRLALFASGRGSNGEALYKAMQEGYINGEFVVIITDHGTAGIVERSKSWNIPLVVIERSDYDSKASFEQAQLDALEPYKIDGIVLAGYMRIVGTKLIERYELKILNIHPALLPKFGGKGMYGHHVHEAVLAAREKESGITIHLVDGHYDHGKILRQAVCPVLPEDTPDTLAERIHALEYAHYPEAIEEYLLRLPTES